MAAIMFQGPPFLKEGGSFGPHFIILNPSLRHCCYVTCRSCISCNHLMFSVHDPNQKLCGKCNVTEEKGRPVKDDFQKYLPWFLEDNPGLTCAKGSVPPLLLQFISSKRSWFPLGLENPVKTG